MSRSTGVGEQKKKELVAYIKHTIKNKSKYKEATQHKKVSINNVRLLRKHIIRFVPSLVLDGKHLQCSEMFYTERKNQYKSTETSMKSNVYIFYVVNSRVAKAVPAECYCLILI